MIQLIAGAAVGSLCTLLATWWLARDASSRAARRETYLELLTMLKAALRVQETGIFDHGNDLPNVVSDEAIDAFNARLELDASSQVRELTVKCFRLVQRFNASHVMRAPVEVDQHGLFNYRFDLVRDVDAEPAALNMRMSLGKVHDELQVAVEQLAARVRREIHGRRT